MQKISPFLWFDTQAEEAANFYVSLFKNSKILGVNRYDAASAKASGKTEGSAMVVSFELEGQRFTALNGGPQFTFGEAVSFSVSCEDQEEIDKFWNALTTNGGAESQCGWLKDRFGLSWQIVPAKLSELLGGGGDPAKAQRAMVAMLGMKKLIIKDLENA